MWTNHVNNITPLSFIQRKEGHVKEGCVNTLSDLELKPWFAVIPIPDLDEDFEDEERECWYFGAGGDPEDFVSGLMKDWAVIFGRLWENKHNFSKTAAQATLSSSTNPAAAKVAEVRSQAFFFVSLSQG